MNTRPEAAARTSSNQLAGEGPGLSSREGVGNAAPSGGTGLQTTASRAHSPMASRAVFPIVPDPAVPDCGNAYKSLKFTHQVYDQIENYQMEKAEANS